jgi:hypothetical protein
MGNNYRVKSEYHGGYPPTYLKRISALFPDRWNTLHLFSGKVDTDAFPGDTVDINPANNPTWVDDAQTLTKVPVEKYDLVLADPPYTDEDSNKYGTTPIKRNLIMQVLGNRLQPGAFIVWLDQALPMYRKDQFDMVGCIGMYKSTNHRIRGVTIFRKKILTEIQECVNLSTLAGETGTNPNPNEPTPNMNPKLIALLFTIGATALTQMANACGGGGEAPAGGKKKKPAAEPEEETWTAPDADDNDDPTAGGGDDDETEKVDYDALRKQAKKKVGALFEADAANKKKVKAILDGLGEANIGDMDNDNLPKFLAKLNKLK